MKRPWFKTQPVDLAFFDDAPVRLVGRFEIDRPAAEVWADMTADEPLPWCKIIDHVRWTSERPFGVGTTREVSALKGLNQFKEHYFHWEEGSRKSFYVTEASSPLAKRFAEDYQVESTGENSCVLTWIVAYEPTLLGRPGDFIQQKLLSSLFRDTRAHYSA